MKHWLFSVALVCFGSIAAAQEAALPLCALPPAKPVSHPYFRPLDPAHIQQSLGMLYDPSGVNNSAGVTDIALITHSTKDGSIIPESWQGILPPENWSPLSIGFGGSLRGDAIVGLGASINVAPQLGALALRGVDENSPEWAKAIKNAFLGNGNGSIRIGWAEVGTVVKAGVFQSGKEAFPGQGPLDILRRAGRVEVGWAWNW